MNANAELLSTPDFKISYPSEWNLEEKDDPPGYNLTSKNLGVKVTLSSLRFPEGSDVDQISNSWLSVRLQSEEEAMSSVNRKVHVQSSVKEIPIGNQAEYWGADSEGRSFRFWCVVARSKIVNIYMESYDKNNDELESIFRNLLKGLRL